MSGLKRLFAGAPPPLAPSGPASALDAAVRAPIPDPRAPDPDASPAGRTAAPEPLDVDTLDADAPTRASGDARMPILRALLADGALAEARLDGPWVEALLALLEGHGRLPEPAALAQALPHLPDRLDEDVLLGICARLGLKGSEIVAPARQIDPAKLPGLLPPVRRGETLRMIRAAEDGRLTVTALDGGDAAPAPAGTLRALVFEQAATDEGLAPPPGVSWLRALAARFAPEAGLLLALGFALNLLLAVVSLSIMVIYDSVLPTRAYDTLAYLAAGAAGALLFEAALRRRRAKLAGRLAARVENLLAASLFAKLMTLPADQVTDIPVSDQISRLRRFEALRDFSAGPFVSVVLETPLIIPLCVVLALIGGPIAFAPVGVAVLCGGAAAMSLGPLRRATAVAALRQTEQTNLTLDAVTNIERIRDLGCADVFGKRLDAAAVLAARAKRDAQAARRRFATLAAAAPPLAGGFAALIGARLVIEGVMTSGALIACMILIWRAVMPLQQAISLAPRLGELGQVATQIDRLMAMRSEPPPPTDIAARAHRRLSGRIGAEALSFRYRAAARPAVAGVELGLAAGEIAALRGPSGSGKTTLLRLLAGHLIAQSGSVVIDGLNLRQLAPWELRRTLAYIPVNPQLFHGSALQNMRLAAPDASLAEVEAAADEVGVLAPLRALPDGLDTRLDSDRQARLPHGLRRGIALTQALLRKPRILLLDEPDQGLAPDEEQAFLNFLDARRGRLTVVMAVARPRHMRAADRIFDMREGRLAPAAPANAPNRNALHAAGQPAPSAGSAPSAQAARRA